MNAAQKILTWLGGIFTGIGTLVTAMFVIVVKLAPEFSGMIWIPLFFVIIGISILIGVYMAVQSARNVVRKGKKYTGKIFGYTENTAYTINNSYTYNTRVRYFDERGTRREAVINTAFTRGDGSYPIGMTIDIYEYKGKWGFDKDSVRNEAVYREQELMDNKPVEPELLNMVAVQCPHCGASFQAASGYSEQCPYCGSYINV